MGSNGSIDFFSAEKPWYAPGKWYMSPYNWEDEVRKQMPNLPKKVEIRDVTTREADDQMGLYLPIEDRVKLALKAAEIGIKELDIGGPQLLPHQGELCRAIRKAYDEAGIDKSITRISGRFFGVAKNPKQEIDAIMAAGATDIRIAIMSPTIVGDEEFYSQLARIPEAVEYCHKEYDATITIGIDDTPGTPMKYIKTVYKGIAEAGADKAWFTDTHGICLPIAEKFLAMEIKKIVGDMPLASHIHNHHGMGVASTLAAIEGGVEEPECTWNGYGDQAGNACLEEVVCNLEAMYGVNTGVKLEKLTEISEMVEKMCGVETQTHKAYSGKGAFAFPSYYWETPTGMILAGVPKEEMAKRIAERRKIRPEGPQFNAATLGRKKDSTWGSYGSIQDRVIEAKLDTMELKHTKEDIKKIRDTLVTEIDKQVASNKELMAKKQKAYFTDEEFEKLVREIMRV